MKKVVFFQPYIQKWRFDFLRRFINDMEDEYEVVSLYGKYISKKQKGGTYAKLKNVNSTGLISLPFQFKFKGQEYPIYLCPFLFFKLVRIRPDVIVTEGEINILNNIQIDLYCKLFRKNYLWWSLGKVRNRKENIINKISRPIIYHYLKAARFIVARNTLAKEYYMNNYNIQEEKIIVVPNSLDHKAIFNEIDMVKDEAIELKKSYNDRKIILFSGALIKGKRIDDLLYSVRKIKEMGIGISCIIVGDGPEREKLSWIVSDYEISNEVEFVGTVYEGVSKYFLIADLVVLPGMGGLVIHHAMIHNKPIITRIADGVEDDLVIDGYNGYVLRDYDNDNLTRTILKIISDDNELKRMGENSGIIVRDSWNMDLMVKQMSTAIKSSF